MYELPRVQVYMDIDYSHGPGYGNTLAWVPGTQAGLGENLVHVPLELNIEKFDKMFVDLMTRPTPPSPKAGQ